MSEKKEETELKFEEVTATITGEIADGQPMPELPKKRGRKPGGKNKPKEEIREHGKPLEGPVTASLTDGLKEVAPEGQKTTTTTTATTATTAKISGKAMLAMCDTVFPLGIGFIFSKTLKAKGKKASDLKLTKDEKSDLEELADEAAKEIFKDTSPVTLFLLAMGGIYASKI